MLDKDRRDKATFVASRRGMTFEEYIGDLLRKSIDREFAEVTKDIQENTTLAHQNRLDSFLAKDYLLAVMEKMPNLTDDGFTTNCEGERFETARKRLAENLGDFALCCKWFRKRTKHQELNSARNSYRISFMVKGSGGEPVSNGAVIAAAIHCGFIHKNVVGSRCATFGMAEEPEWFTPPRPRKTTKATQRRRRSK